MADFQQYEPDGTEPVTSLSHDQFDLTIPDNLIQNPTGIPLNSEVYVDLNNIIIQAKKQIEKLRLEYLGLGVTPEINARMAARGQYYSMMYANGTASSTQNIDWRNGNVQEVGVSSNTTFTLTNGRAGGRYILKIIQDESGSRTYTWPDSVSWPSHTAPASSTSGKIDIITMVYDGSSFFSASAVDF